MNWRPSKPALTSPTILPKVPRSACHQLPDSRMESAMNIVPWLIWPLILFVVQVAAVVAGLVIWDRFLRRRG